MKISHLKKGIKIGIKAAHKTAKQLNKEFAPLIKAGHLTAKEAKGIAIEAERLGRRAKEKALAAAKSEAKVFLGKMGYMSKAEGEALKRKIAELERKQRAKKRR